jgi:Pentapeptide repeats (8 copies)
MRPIARSWSVALLVGCLIAAVAVAGGQENSVSLCEGLYKDRWLTPDDLATVLSNHRAWLHSKREPNDTRKANLCQARLSGANLQRADLLEANLQETELIEANLQEARLFGANLQRADLLEANLHQASLYGAGLIEANLSGANMQEADLTVAILTGARLSGANLQKANLTVAYLAGVDLSGANFQEADLFGANLQGAIYEPNPVKLPNFWTLTEPENKLETLVFHKSPAALFALREAFKRGGMHTQERQITYAIEHTRRLQAWKSRDLWKKSESLFNYVWFELPSGYGMAPRQALAGLGLLIALFSIPYMVAVTTHGPAGIWMVWIPDRVHKAEGEANPVRVTSAFFFSPLKMWSAGRWQRGVARGLSVLLIGLYFSVLSAFSLGWRELNVGTWIARVQPREYMLRATGWVRTVSGIQSLLSVYLLALWVLTYFGRPFE